MAKKILPPNHPERPDWQILNGLLGLEGERIYTPPKNPQKAAALLKLMLETAFEENPRDVVHRLGGQQLRRTTSTFRISGANEEHFVDEITSRLENRKGRETTEKNPTNNAIRSWRPEEGGVVAYVRGRVQFSVGDMIAENHPIMFAGGVHRDDFRNQPLSMSSLDHIREAGGAELSASGQFVRQRAGNGDEMELNDAFDIDSASAGEGKPPPAELIEARDRYDAEVLDEKALTSQIDYEEISRKIYERMAESEDLDLDVDNEGVTDEALGALDEGDNQVINGNLDAAAVAQIKEISTQVNGLEMTDPNRADIAWAITALDGENILGELVPEKRITEMKQVAVNLVDTLLAGHEDEQIFKEVIAEFDPMRNKLSDPDYSDILQESIKVDYRQRLAASAEERQAINPPSELIPSVSPQLSIFEAKEKMDAFDALGRISSELYKASRQRQDFDPHDPQRPDLKMLEEMVEGHEIDGYEEASPSQKTYMLAQIHWSRFEPSIDELSDHGKTRLRESIRDYEPSKTPYLGFLQEKIAEMSEEGLFSESPWSAPELGQLTGSYLGSQISQRPNTDDSEAVREHEKFERRMHRSYSEELKEEKQGDPSANQLNLFDQMMGGVVGDEAPSPAKSRTPRLKKWELAMEVDAGPDSEFDDLFEPNREALGDNGPTQPTQNNDMEV